MRIEPEPQDIGMPEPAPAVERDHVASARLAAGIVQVALRYHDSRQSENDAHAAQPRCRFRLTQQVGGRWTRAQSGLLVQIRGLRLPSNGMSSQQVTQGLRPDRIHESDSSERRALVPAELDSRNSSARDMAALASRQEFCLTLDFRYGHSSKTMNR